MRLAPLPPPYYTNEKKKSPLLKWITIIIILLTIIVLSYFVYTKKKNVNYENNKEENIIKDASELKKEEYSSDEIKIPTVEADNGNVTEEEKQELQLPSSYLANTNNELLSQEFLYKTEISKIKLIRDEIYARHGFIFKDSETQKYFEEKTWYVKNPNYTDELLNDMEVQNLEIISKFLNEEKEVEKIDKQ